MMRYKAWIEYHVEFMFWWVRNGKREEILRLRIVFIAVDEMVSTSYPNFLFSEQRGAYQCFTSFYLVEMKILWASVGFV